MHRDIPLILDTASDALDRQALNYIVASATIGQPFTAPPGMPEERVQALRRAFDATMTTQLDCRQQTDGHQQCNGKNA